MAMPLRPLHFLSREDGTLTALIAVDELPHYVSIRGVPRTLNHSDTQGMTSLGTVKSRGQFYLLDNAIQQASKVVGEKPNISGQSLMQGGGPDGFGHLAVALQGVSLDSPVTENPEWTLNNLNNQLVVKSNSGARHGKSSQNGNQAKKEYCSFWLRHGECDYQQQGCIFKHEMPTDKPTLDKLGLRDIPRWYREKHGMKASGNGNVRARHEGNGRTWRPENHHHPISNYGDRREGHSHRMVNTDQSDERSNTPTALQHGPGLGLASNHNHHAIYDGPPATSRYLPPNLSTNVTVKNMALDPSKLSGRCDLISIDELRKSPTPDHTRANCGFGNFAHPQNEPDLMDYPANGPGPSVARISGPAEPRSSDTVSHNGAILPRSYGINSMPTPGSNYLWTMGQNEGTNWNSMSLNPFQSTVGAPVGNSKQNGQDSQLRKKAQRSRRLYQRSQHTNGPDITNDDNLRPMSVSPINTTIQATHSKGAPEATSPSFSSHPHSASYDSSPCSPRSGPTASRLSDNLDFRGNSNHSYGSRGSPVSTESTNTNTNGGTNCDLFDLNLNGAISGNARQA